MFPPYQLIINRSIIIATEIMLKRSVIVNSYSINSAIATTIFRCPT